MKRLLFVVSEDWYFVSHRLYHAEVAIEQGFEVAVLSRVNAHRDIVESAGIKLFDWRIRRGSVNPFTEIRALWDIFIAIRSFKPGLIHSVSLKPVLYTALTTKFYGVAARVFALGGLGFVFSSQKSLAKILRPILTRTFRWVFSGKSVHLILQNPDDYRLIVDANVIEQEKISLIRGVGVDTHAFAPKFEPNSIPLAVLPARLLWDKGVGEFVAAARILKDQGINARFALVGKPDEHNPECISSSQINDWVNESLVEVWGERNDMPDVMNQAQVVCLPSYREGLPKVLLEAASCARPIVACDVPGCREVVTNGQNGFLVPMKDARALAEALRQLLLDPDLCKQMGKAGREKVLQEFSQEQVAEDTLRVWSEVLP